MSPYDEIREIINLARRAGYDVGAALIEDAQRDWTLKHEPSGTYWGRPIQPPTVVGQITAADAAAACERAYRGP